MSGVLTGTVVVEFASIGPGPFCGMMLADMGADVIRIDRPRDTNPPGLSMSVFGRGKRSIVLDLKSPADHDLALLLVSRADAIIEGMRPGVMERLGLGPAECRARNPQLVYGRVTGWGQEGPLSAAAGHDLTYLALSGALWPIGRANETPPPPLNYVGDFGGGGMLLTLGILGGLFHAARTGQGQVVDAAMVDGAALQATMIFGLSAAGAWRHTRASNLLDGGAPFYDTYRCSDGKEIAVAAIESKFHDALRAGLGLASIGSDQQMDQSKWPEHKRELAAIFATRGRDEWCDLFEGTDACVAPVLDLQEAPRHPHAAARNAFAVIDGVVQPAPAPRFHAAPSSISRPPPTPNQDGAEIRAWLAGGSTTLRPPRASSEFAPEAASISTLEH